VWRACGGYNLPQMSIAQNTQFHAVNSQQPFTGDEYEKEARLLSYVFSVTPPQSPLAVCKAIEQFGCENLSRPYGGAGGWAPSAGRWLKIAGGEKSDVLTTAARLASCQAAGRFLEVGTYCGYSSIQLALACPGVQITSIEGDPGLAVIARSLIAYAGLAHVVDVRVGHSQDVLPHLGQNDVSEHMQPFDLVFFDQRGSCYSADLMVLEQLGAVARGTVVVADNVLKPGAPAFLWHVLRNGCYETQVVAVNEYLMQGVEDWMTLSVCMSDCIAPPPPLPRGLQRLEWEADKMRAQAEQVPGVSFAAWADFATQMSKGLASVGITATAGKMGSLGKTAQRYSKKEKE